MNELMMKLDPSTWYFLGGLMAIIVVLSLVKKAIKMAFLIGVLAISFVFLGPKSAEMQKQYGFSYEDGVVSVTVEGDETKIDTENLKGVRMEKNEHGILFMVFEYEDEEGRAIEIPNIMEGFLKGKIAELNEKVTGGA